MRRSVFWQSLNPNTPASGSLAGGWWPTALSFFAFFGGLLLLNWPTLDDPPTWDGAMGVHPAAITLSRSDFDLAGLLHERAYMQGGPNTHSLSLVTWCTALAYRSLAGSRWLLPVMHVCHFALAAVALAAVYRFARPALGGQLAIGLSLLVLCNPIVLAQTGCLYVEVPLLASTMVALIAWSDNRPWRAAFFTLLTFYIKETGLILAGALTAAAVLEAGPLPRRLTRAAGVFLPAVTAFFVNKAIYHPPGAAPYVPLPYREYVRYNIIQRLTPVPDLCVLIGLFLLVTVVRGPALWRAWRQPNSGATGAEDRVLPASPVAISHLMVLSFIGFFLVANYAGEVYLLPRYFVQIMPCLALGVIDAARRVAQQRVVLAGIILCSAAFLVNRYGTFYAPVTTNDGSAAERSLEYRDLLEVQRQAMATLADCAKQSPVFYGYPEHFLLNYPEMGFTDRRPDNGYCVLFDPPYNQARLADYPSLFYIVLDYPALGGQRLFALYSQAKRYGCTLRTAGDFRKGHYHVLVLKIAAPGIN
ncbi:MAG TPA: hypothetical protein VHC22_18150 [Pirellulales bacterium]|nr:hypothetical protein [Pirellulales bacterium]